VDNGSYPHFKLQPRLRMITKFSRIRSNRPEDYSQYALSECYYLKRDVDIIIKIHWRLNQSRPYKVPTSTYQGQTNPTAYSSQRQHTQLLYRRSKHPSPNAIPRKEKAGDTSRTSHASHLPTNHETSTEDNGQEKVHLVRTT
jgi:hypothetical protein